MIIKGSKDPAKKGDNGPLDTDVKNSTETIINVGNNNQVMESKEMSEWRKHKLRQTLILDFFCEKTFEMIFVVGLTTLAIEWPLLNSILNEIILTIFVFFGSAKLGASLVRNNPIFRKYPACIYLFKSIDFDFLTVTFMLLGIYGPKLYPVLCSCFVIISTLLTFLTYGFFVFLASSTIINHHKGPGFWLNGLVVPTIALILLQLMYLNCIQQVGFEQFRYSDFMINITLAISLSLAVSYSNIRDCEKFINSNAVAELINRKLLVKLASDKELDGKKQGLEHIV